MALGKCYKIGDSVAMLYNLEQSMQILVVEGLQLRYHNLSPRKQESAVWVPGDQFCHKFVTTLVLWGPQHCFLLRKWYYVVPIGLFYSSS